MFSEEIQDYAKKNKKPDPGAYEIKNKQKLLGALNLKDERTTFADEALFLGKRVVPPYDAKFEQVQERSPIARMYLLKEATESKASAEKAVQPSPVSYNLEESFKSTQLITPRFFIRKGTIASYAVEASKRKNFVPAPGHYDIDKANSIMTKGASKGWK